MGGRWWLFRQALLKQKYQCVETLIVPTWIPRHTPEYTSVLGLQSNCKVLLHGYSLVRAIKVIRLQWLIWVSAKLIITTYSQAIICATHSVIQIWMLNTTYWRTRQYCIVVVVKEKIPQVKFLTYVLQYIFKSHTEQLKYNKIAYNPITYMCINAQGVCTLV